MCVGEVIPHRLELQPITDGVHHDAISGGSPIAPTIQNAEGRGQRQMQRVYTCISVEHIHEIGDTVRGLKHQVYVTYWHQ